ncbi:DUF924 family protein [Geoalkalibacter sp.]|uniref:DUF924 family protein n=1 Tax=Geoalkalibacter sp. TaxID=3041440 RepID=UPI00272EAB16|nr:DUF924 family protein [Geoalkalibacter sp.]
MQDEILHFWFAGLEGEGVPPPERLRFWFNGGEQVDGLIRERFAQVVERAGMGEFDDWRQTPRGSLALLVLLDQFPRNMYRDSARAYAYDPKALEICTAGLNIGQDQALNLVERAFFYLPLEHAEDLAMQERSVALFAQLLAEAPPVLREVCSGFYDYALRHQAVIARFGRFPHRNRALGRVSTAAEEEFLRQPGSSF